MSKFLMVLIAFGSFQATAESSVFAICNQPDVLRTMPEIVQRNCEILQQNKLTYTVSDRKLVVKGRANGQPYTDVYDFPEGSTYTAQGRQVVITPPAGR